jgi:hypothetical protein
MLFLIGSAIVSMIFVDYCEEDCVEVCRILSTAPYSACRADEPVDDLRDPDHEGTQLLLPGEVSKGLRTISKASYLLRFCQ